MFPNHGASGEIIVTRGMVGVSREQIEAFRHPDFHHHSQNSFVGGGTGLAALGVKKMPCLQIIAGLQSGLDTDERTATGCAKSR